MTFQLVGGDTGNLDAVVNQVNQNIAQLKVQDTTNIFKDDAGTRRVLLGKGKDGFYGLKVSQEGTDVYDGDNADMTFNSDNNTLKVVDTGTITLPFAADGTTETITVDHGLGYTPIVLAFQTNASGDVAPLPNTLIESTGADAGKVLQLLTWYADDTNVNFYNQSQLQGTAGGQVKYYLLQETAN